MTGMVEPTAFKPLVQLDAGNTAQLDVENQAVEPGSFRIGQKGLG